MRQAGEMTQVEYARHRGVSKQAIWKLIDAGRIPFRIDDDGTKLINAADADFALNENRARVEAEAAPISAAQTSGLTRARTVTEVYRARLAHLEYHKRVGELVPLADVEVATTRCSDTLVALVKQLSTRAEEIYAASAEHGVQGARIALKAAERDLREKVAAAFNQLAAEAAASTSQSGEEVE
jgi:hypothetical protein